MKQRSITTLVVLTAVGGLQPLHAQNAPAVNAPAAGTAATDAAVIAATAAAIPPATAETVVAPPPANPVIDTTSLGDTREQAATGATPITLEEAIVLTLQNNPQMAAARAALAAADARIGEARSAGGIQVGITGNANFSRNGGSSSFVSSTGSTGTSTGTGTGTGGTGTGGTGTGGTGTGTGGTGTGTGGTGTGTSTGTSTGSSTTTNSGTNTFLGFDTSQSLGISAALPIYTGGKVKASTRAAELAVRAQVDQTVQVEQNLVLAATTSYLNILRNGQLLQVEESNLAVSRERQRVANLRYEAGASPRLDVYQANTVLADAAQRRITASNNLAQAKASLNTLIGQVPETPMQVAPITTLDLRLPLPADLSQISTATTAALRTTAESAQPSIAALREQEGVATANIDVAKSQRRPTLGLSLSSFLRNPTGTVGRLAASVGLSVAQGLFDSGRSRSQIREAQSLLDQARFNTNLQRITTANNIENSLLSLDTAQGQLASADTAVTAAQAALTAAQLGYQAGARTALDVSDAQSALLAAQTTAVNARFDVASSQAQISSSVGILTGEGQAAYQQVLQQELQRNQAAEAQAKTVKKRKKFLGVF